MKHVLPCILFLFTPIIASAQQWSAEEQEVLNHAAECFQSFTEATQQNDFQIWVQRCRPTDESLFWHTQGTGPLNLEGLLNMWNLYFPNIKRSASPGLDPIRIRLVDNMAFVYGYTWWFEEKEDGTLEYSHDKRLEVYRRQDGEWRLQTIIWIPVSVD